MENGARLKALPKSGESLTRAESTLEGALELEVEHTDVELEDMEARLLESNPEVQTSKVVPVIVS